MSHVGIPSLLPQQKVSLPHKAPPTILLIDGEVYSWGCGRRGRLGYECEGNKLEPTLITFENSHRVQAIQSDHSVTILISVPTN